MRIQLLGKLTKLGNFRRKKSMEAALEVQQTGVQKEYTLYYDYTTHKLLAKPGLKLQWRSADLILSVLSTPPVILKLIKSNTAPMSFLLSGKYINEPTLTYNFKEKLYCSMKENSKNVLIKSYVTTTSKDIHTHKSRLNN